MKASKIHPLIPRGVKYIHVTSLIVIKWIQYAENRWDYLLAKPSTTEFFLDVTKNHLLLPNSQGISECKATLGVNKMFCCLVACVRQRIENS